VPFKPFEQLMGVLPANSRQHIPACLQPLMVDANSPILDFYPTKFELDMEGKKSPWEAIVKIPFIDEKRLLGAIQSRIHQLTPAERKRNETGISHSFSKSKSLQAAVKSSLPGILPDLVQNYSKSFPHEVKVGNYALNKLCPGARVRDRQLPGFPSVFTIDHTAVLGNHSVTVFQHPSKYRFLILEMKALSSAFETDLRTLHLKKLAIN
jgi:5'-3' exoribonuclease 1